MSDHTEEAGNHREGPGAEDHPAPQNVIPRVANAPVPVGEKPPCPRGGKERPPRKKCTRQTLQAEEAAHSDPSVGSAVGGGGQIESSLEEDGPTHSRKKRKEGNTHRNCFTVTNYPHGVVLKPALDFLGEISGVCTEEGWYDLDILVNHLQTASASAYHQHLSPAFTASDQTSLSSSPGPLSTPSTVCEGSSLAFIPPATNSQTRDYLKNMIQHCVHSLDALSATKQRVELDRAIAHLQFYISASR